MSLKNTIKQLESDLKALKRSAKAEAAFKRMSKAQKRVAVAKDVIASIKAKQLVAKARTYIDVKAEGKDGYDNNTFKHPDFQTALAMGQQCTACALGGLFVCAVKFENKIATEDANDNIDQPDLHDYLQHLFPYEQLQLIEIAFEQSWGIPGFDNGDDVPDKWKTAVAFGQKHPTDDAARMTAIMRNIIRNEGTFIP